MLTITVPMPPNVANATRFGHWRTRHNAKKAYWQALDALQMAKRVPPPPKVPLARVRLSSAMVVGNFMDHDNAIARHKWCIDWLVTRGYLVDDRRENLTWDGLPDQRISRKEPASITLTLTEHDE